MKWILAGIIILLLGAFYQLGLLVYAMYVFLGVLLLSRLLTYQWVDRLSATRYCQKETVEIGEKLDVTISVQNESRVPVSWVLLEDSLPVSALIQHPPRLRAIGDRLVLTQLSGKEEALIEYQVEFLMRGYYQIGPLLTESGDLFGLHRRYRVVTEPHFVLVLPKVVPLQGYDLSTRQPVGEIRMTHRLFEDPTRISGVRQYEMGDSFNRIHWKASARTGTLHSKTYEPSSVAGATILLDFHEKSYEGRGDIVRTELAVTTAASLAHALQQMGQRVGLVTNGRDAADRIREEGWHQEFRTRSLARAKVGMRETSDRLRPVIIETRRSADQFQQILEALGRLERTDGLHFPELVVETASRLPRNATVVSILGNVTPETAIALGNLSRQGYSVTAMLIVFDEPAPPDWAKLSDWAGWLLAAGVEVRRIENEAMLSHVCSEYILR